MKYNWSFNQRFQRAIRGDKEIEGEVISFFSNLYGPEVAPKRFVLGIDWSPIFERELEDLPAPFNVEEIKQAIFRSGRSKSPGLDGFFMAFYQDKWDLLKGDLVKVFQEVF